ncbi:ABC transporter permease [Telmatocola sphagniphila]|uniref:ABC transporter permease n=2 Tax=Telmatocola sphagniphila TaxID=1123043 RepID=A0A8E6BBY4_9BACT|nr:ABC transporter permease [Telmatocola sphagniphila]
MHLTRARLLEFFREPAAVFWVYGFPLGLALILGIAFQDRPVEKLNVDVITTAENESARTKLSETLKVDTRLVLNTYSLDESRKRLMSGKTDLILEPLAATEKPNFKVWEERNRPESVLTRSVVESILNKSKLGENAVQIEDVQLQEVGRRYIDFLIPGLIGMNLMGGGLFGVGFVIVDMRVRKLLKRFLATPMRKTDFTASVMASRLLFTIPEVSVLFGFSYLFFGVVCKGSLLDLFIVMLFGGVAFTGLGLLIASRAKTIETVSGLMNAILIPQWAVSGVFFSAERFPEAFQPFIQPLPLTALNNALRTIMNEGKGVLDCLPQLGILTAWGLVSFFIALRIFRWR